MKVLLIPDKFKGSLRAVEVIQALDDGVKAVFPQAEVHGVVASDGGDGFLNAIALNINCDLHQVATVDPLGRKIMADYLFDKKASTAYIELAKASGLELLADHERSATRTSTYGTGLQIKDAVLKGATKVYLGLGGSATNDAGLGIAHALGYDFINAQNEVVPPVGGNLGKINTIKKGESASQYQNVRFFAVNDVNNVLFGPNGAAFCYARQKGACEGEIKALDVGLRHIDTVCASHFGQRFSGLAGTGAAGGTAYGLKVFFNAGFIGGIDFILGLSRVTGLMGKNAFDLIITGEGKLDDQTFQGKLINGVVALGNRYKIPVIAVCGKLEVSQKKCKENGIAHVIEIANSSMPHDFNMRNAAQLLRDSVANFFKQNYL